MTKAKTRNARPFYCVGRHMVLLTTRQKRDVIEALQSVGNHELARKVGKSRKI